MNTKATKCLAVLSVMAMVFVAFAGVASTDAGVATDTNVQIGDYKFYAPSTASISVDGNVITYSGYFTANDIAGWTKSVADEWKPEMKYYSAIGILIETSNYVKVEQSNSALKDGYPQGETSGDLEWGKDGWAIDTNGHEVRYYKDTFAPQNQECLCILVPQNNTNVTFTITERDPTTGEETSNTYTLVFADEASTKITLSEDLAPVSPTTGKPWEYTATDNTLKLNEFRGNVSFATTGALTVKLTGTNYLQAFTTNDRGIIDSTSESDMLTIVKGGGETEAKLSILQLNPEGISIRAPNMTIGSGSQEADVSIVTMGGAQGIFADKDLKIKSANLDLTAGEKALNAYNALTTTGKNNIELKIDGTLHNNLNTNNAIFGLKVKGTLDIGANTVIVTDGAVLYTKPDAAKILGKVIIHGGYEQTDYKEVYGVAGFVNLSGNANAKLIGSEAEATTAGFYVLDGAESYGVTVTNSSNVVVQTTKSVNLASLTTEPAIIDEIAKDLNNCTNATITFTGGTITNLDVYNLMKNSTIAKLDSITLIAGAGSIKTIVASKDVSVTDTKIVFSGFTVSGKFTNGTDTARLDSVKGTFGVYEGSVHIDGNIESGNIYIAGDADISGQLTKTMDIFMESGATSASLEILENFSIKGSGILNIHDVEVSVDSEIKLIDGGSIAFRAGATFLTPVEIEAYGNDGGNVRSEVDFTQGLELCGTKIVIGSNITAKKALVLDANEVTSSYNISVTGTFAMDSKVTISGTKSSVKAITVDGDAFIAGELKLENTKLTLNGITEVYGDILYGANDESVITNNGTMTVLESGFVGATKITKTTTDDSGSHKALNFVNNNVLVIKGVVVDLTNNKTVRLYGDIGYTYNDGTKDQTAGKLVNDDIIYVMDAEAEIYAATTGTGTIDTSAVSKEVTISGELLTGETKFTKYQIVTFIGDTVLRSGANVVFEGNVVIPNNVTVTIENGASMKVNSVFGKLTNNGAIVIEGKRDTTAGLTVDKAQVENNGTISADYNGNVAADLISVAADSVFTNNGTITVGEKSKLNIKAENFINAPTGQIIIKGDLTGTVATAPETPGKVVNYGLVTIDSEVNSDVVISNAYADAAVNIVMTAKKVTVNDTEFAVKGKIDSGKNTIVIEPKDNTTCGGVIITSDTYKPSELFLPHTVLAIEGSLAVSAPAGTATDVKATVTFTSDDPLGLIGVHGDDELSFSNVELKVLNTTAGIMTEFYIGGQVSMDENCTFANDGELTVDGALYLYGTTITPGANSIINAAMFEIPGTIATKKTIVYTNVPNAVAAASEVSVNLVTVTGEVDVDESTVVPVGMTLLIASGADVTICEDVVVEISADETGFATLKNSGDIDVEGKLVIDDAAKSKKNTGTIESEVLLKVDKTEIYTTLAWAIKDVGTEEATLTLCGDTVIKNATTIPENITVDTNGFKFEVRNVELTIDGVLFINGGTAYTVTGDDGEIVLNGLIMKASKMEYNGNEYPAGLYFSAFDASMYYIGNIADAQEYALIADNDKLVYCGDLVTPAIDFDVDATLVFEDTVTAVNMNAGSGANIIFKDDVSILGSNLGACTLTFEEGIAINGVFTSPMGAITFIDSKAVKESTITVQLVGDEPVMTLAGEIGLGEEVEDFQVATVGDVVIKADLAELTVGLGTTTIAANCNIFAFEVYGDLVVEAGYKLTAFAGLVYGSLIAEDATETAKAASITMLYLGVGLEYDYDSYNYNLSAAAVVSGDVNVTLAFVGADADVSESSIALLPYTTDVYVEGDLMLTAYAASGDIEFMDALDNLGISPTDPNAEFLGWFDEEGNVVDEDATVGEYEEIYALFDYNVYDVTIVTGAGIASVTIIVDGKPIQMVREGTNTFVIHDLPAGSYQIKGECALGYEGDLVLSTADGTVLKDNKFVISAGGETDLGFQLNGATPTPEPEPVTPEEKSEWTITTILLVVLVILIAIMAVIVAMKLNRS